MDEEAEVAGCVEWSGVEPVGPVAAGVEGEGDGCYSWDGEGGGGEEGEEGEGCGFHFERGVLV